jgi:hypothetical protein
MSEISQPLKSQGFPEQEPVVKSQYDINLTKDFTGNTIIIT